MAIVYPWHQIPPASRTTSKKNVPSRTRSLPTRGVSPIRSVATTLFPRTTFAASHGIGTTASGSSSYTSDFPGYNDPYGSILSKLAAQMEAQRAFIQQNLAAREAAITKLYNDQIPVVGQLYGQASGQAKDVNDAVAKQLGLEGQGASSDLLSKLGLIGAPGGSVEDASNKLNSYYSGLGGANYAMDAGDVQRLIGAGAENQSWLAKQPGIIGSQLESQAQQDLADLFSQFSDQQTQLQLAQAQGQNDYNMSKFQYDTQTKQQQAQDRKDAEQLYWDNYWKKRDEAERRWEVQVSLGKDKAAQKTKTEIAAMDNQAKVDVANIRSGTQITTNAANNATKTEVANINANAKGGKGNAAKPTTGATIQKAKQAALDAVFNLSTGKVRNKVHTDNQVQALVNNVLRQYGIQPYSTQGTAIRRWVFSQINGKPWNVPGGGTWQSGKDRLPK